MEQDPLQLLRDLGISTGLDELLEDQQFFAYAHLGMEDVRVGKLLQLLENDPTLKPPRSGHIGNWDEIGRGRGFKEDFNAAICRSGYGRALIYGLTQTEADGGTGDWLYRPGSVMQRGQRRPLPLYTWDGKAFVQRSRDVSYFVPFVQTELDGQLVPLGQFHQDRMVGTVGFPYAHMTDVLMRNADEVRAVLTLLLEEAHHAENPRSAYQDLVSHLVKADGTVARCDIRREGAAYYLDDRHYGSTAALVDQVMLTFRAVTEPRAFFGEMASLPEALPVLSNVLNLVFFARLMLHRFPEGPGRSIARGVNVHPHWGARGMAGFPPRATGYLGSRSKRRSLRRICNTLGAHHSGFSPIYYVMLPGLVFTLWPASTYPRDVELVAELFRTVAAAPLEHQAVETVVKSWLSRHQSSLSPYFLARFRAQGEPLPEADVPLESVPAEPPGFRDLTFPQLCWIVGALTEDRAE